MASNKPWQLKMFDRSLKKKMKVAALIRHFPPLAGRKCLLLTCGDNNGAINYHLRSGGGDWTWCDFEPENIAAMEQLLAEKVLALDKKEMKLPFADKSFDLAVSIDVHEHLQDPQPVTDELSRVTGEGGKVVVTTPNGDERKLAVRLKHLVGMRKQDYGHVRLGFDIPDLEKLLRAAGLRPCASSSYSKFFTEFLELVINFAYVKVLAKKSKVKVEKGSIAPASQEHLRSVKKSYRFYSVLYPFFLAFSQLDRLLFWKRGYAVIVEADK